MVERERLVELIEKEIDTEKTGINSGWLADHLLYNGVIVPPCKVGDTVFEIVEIGGYIPHLEVSECRVIKIEICALTPKTLNIITDGKCGFMGKGIYNIKDFGKTVFLTREDAEKALKERERK